MPTLLINTTIEVLNGHRKGKCGSDCDCKSIVNIADLIPYFYICIAYGVSPSLKVGFEEALFLASKIKNSLGGSLSTEKVFYLLFITLQRKHKSVTT